ncbi:MAG: symmetrical bis(5'-nucleosyl)-tetraphosphatase [Methylophilaceae bacterium]|nr:symmetrical bis(5'-nucleosyl)-tetraphosphatase [Methylophilaceae bacterium]MDG1821574.1 symmetrical bis(5'-nucleosyl)-tetraphosphatase [Methylophilaceae bacterium]
MSTYAIGDIQGCYHAFQALLKRIQFNVETDDLWLAGDIINRGSGSLEVLRWCYEHRANIQMVLGNHDLHAIAISHGIKQLNQSDTLQVIFDAPDAELLLTWLRHQPLMVSNGDYVMVHAGLLPQWQISEALSYAKEVEVALRSEHYVDFLANMYGDSPNVWHDRLHGFDRLRVITNVMTRMRICSVDGALDFSFKGAIKAVPPGFLPWFDLPDRQSLNQQIIVGHWSALGLYQGQHIYALDTGCLWGGQLTAMCLETKQLTQVNADKKDQPFKV